MRALSSPTSIYKFVLRLPQRLRQQIVEAARYHRRSMNSEIVTRLEVSFSGLPSRAEAQRLESPQHAALQLFFDGALNEDERLLVRTYRSLSANKRAALRDLLD